MAWYFRLENHSTYATKWYGFLELERSGAATERRISGIFSKLAVQACETAMAEKHKKDLEAAEKDMMSKANQELDALKLKHSTDLGAKLFALRQEHELELSKLEEKRQDEFREQMATALKERESKHRAMLKEQELRIESRARKEVDQLRARFKIMQSSGAVASSPSASDTELNVSSSLSLSFMRFYE